MLCTMKTWLIIGCWLLSSHTICGQTAGSFRLLFKSSSVVLANADTLAGTVALQLSPDILYLTLPDGTMRAFEPKAVAAFAVQGEIRLTPQGQPDPAHSPDPTVVRLFRSVPRPAAQTGQPPIVAFFEQIGAGPVLLLHRPCRVVRSVALNTPTTAPDALARANMQGGRGQPLPTAALYPSRFRTISEVQDAYFLAWATGKFLPLQSPKKNVLAAFPEHAAALKQFVQARQLDCASPQGLNELVSYANSLGVETGKLR